MFLMLEKYWAIIKRKELPKNGNDIYYEKSFLITINLKK